MEVSKTHWVNVIFDNFLRHLTANCAVEKPVEQLNRAKVNSRSVDKKNLPKKFNRGDYPIYKWPKGIKAKIKNGKRQEDILSFKECVSTKCKRKSLSGVYTEAKYKDCLQRECGTWVWPIEWQEWSEWSDCSTTCGKGSQIRARACTGDQGSCPGEFKETKDCWRILEKCPASKWQEWGAWSVCSTTCGKGGKIRARACAGPHRSCQGKATEAKGCRQPECGGILSHWQEWSEWSWMSMLTKSKSQMWLWFSTIFLKTFWDKLCRKAEEAKIQRGVLHIRKG